MPRHDELADAIHADIEPPRRQALKHMACLLGLSLSAHSLTVLANTNRPARAARLALLRDEQWQMTGELADLIIPTSDTPGALAAGVPDFIDRYLAECVSHYEQREFLQGLKKIDAVAEDNFHKTFLACTHKQHIKLLTAIEAGELGFDAADNQFFKQFKALTLLGYYTSEVGASKELAYLAVPGGYKGNVPFASVGKAWALNF